MWFLRLLGYVMLAVALLAVTAFGLSPLESGRYALMQARGGDEPEPWPLDTRTGEVCIFTAFRNIADGRRFVGRPVCEPERRY